MDCPSFKKWHPNLNQTILISRSNDSSNVIIKSFLTHAGGSLVYGRLVLIANSNSVLEVLQPMNDVQGCEKHLRSLPSETGLKLDDCEVVLNAGLFDTHTGECYGNIINDGRVYLNFGGIRNAHFGIKKDGHLFFGYLSEEEVLSGHFQSLVGGAVWLLRNGLSVVNNSILEECAHIQETSKDNLRFFATVVSARSAIGAFANGTVVVVQVGGRSRESGINLFDLAQLMADMGVVAAINLDGGGSSTVIINRTLVSYPSDKCQESLFTCERQVTTVLCVRAHCPLQCPSGSTCVHGFCEHFAPSFNISSTSSSKVFSSSSKVFTSSSKVFTSFSTSTTVVLIVALSVTLSLLLAYVTAHASVLCYQRLRRRNLFRPHHKDVIDREPLLDEGLDL